MNAAEIRLSATELSKRTGCSTCTIWRLKRAGKIPFLQPGGGNCRVMFPADALDRVEADVVSDSPLPQARPDSLAPSRSGENLDTEL